MVFRYAEAKKIVKNKGLRISWASEQLGLAPGSLGNYLNGYSRPSKQTALQLAKLLGVEPSRLLKE